MAGFLTDGREAFIAALQGNLTLSTAVKVWLVYGSGLQQRLIIEPSMCPLCSIAPAEGDVTMLANIYAEIPQSLQIDFAVDEDVEPMESLLSALYDEILNAKESGLGLASEGLCNVQSTGTTWIAQPDKTGARVVWLTTTNVRLTWKRLRPLA